MRKAIALFILLLLPLQLAFAAGAEYCELGKVEKSTHLGHHVHKGDSSKSTPDSGKSHGDCGFCHLGCAHAQLSEYRWDATPFVATHTPHHGFSPTSHDPGTVLRPPRAALA